jgi:hypothetical protein
MEEDLIFFAKMEDDVHCACALMGLWMDTGAGDSHKSLKSLLLSSLNYKIEHGPLIIPCTPALKPMSYKM